MGSIELLIFILFIITILLGSYFLITKKQSLIKVIDKMIVFFSVITLLMILTISKFTIPTIILKGKKTINIEVKNEYKDEGYYIIHLNKTIDNKVIEKSDVNINQLGTYNVTYSINYLDKEITSTRIVNVIDTINPVINIEGDENITIEYNEEYKEPGFTATDNYDGDISDKVVVTSNIDNNPGEYKVIYSVTDSSGNKFEIYRNVTRKKNVTGTIYLTFDDGPSNSTEPILNILKKYDIKATFFVIGFNKEYDSIIKRMDEEGHTVALHSYTHNYKLIYSSEDAYFNDLIQIQDRVNEVINKKQMIIRFPGGVSNTVSSFNKGIMGRLAKQVNDKGFHFFDWNVDSSDAWGARNSDDVYNNVINNLGAHRNNVVLMHDFSNNQKTIDALEKIIKKCIDDGYTFSAINMDTPVVHHGIYNY